MNSDAMTLNNIILLFVGFSFREQGILLKFCHGKAEVFLPHGEWYNQSGYI